MKSLQYQIEIKGQNKFSLNAKLPISCQKKKKMRYLLQDRPQPKHQIVLCEPVLLLTGRTHSQSQRQFCVSKLPSRVLDLAQHLWKPAKE